MKVTINRNKDTDNEVEDTLKIQIYNTVVKVEKELAITISLIDIITLSGVKIMSNNEINSINPKFLENISEVLAQAKKCKNCC